MWERRHLVLPACWQKSVSNTARLRGAPITATVSQQKATGENLASAAVRDAHYRSCGQEEVNLSKQDGPKQRTSCWFVYWDGLKAARRTPLIISAPPTIQRRTTCSTCPWGCWSLNCSFLYLFIYFWMIAETCCWRIIIFSPLHCNYSGLSVYNGYHVHRNVTITASPHSMATGVVFFFLHFLFFLCCLLIVERRLMQHCASGTIKASPHSSSAAWIAMQTPAN